MSATISAESETGNGLSFHSLYAGILSRERSSISILGLLGEEDWSKLTRLQIGDGLPF